jgi:hypothetical protein
MSAKGHIFIGNGRSAKVYLSTKGDKQIATKIFTGENTSKVILYILKGSANPYTWCEDAIKSAMLRRSLLSKLCEFWFEEKVRLPETYGYSWNENEKAFQVEAEFIGGCHAPMLNPLDEQPFSYINELQNDVMAPLQKLLIESGFDGLVWQAGKGNPVAASNFMVEFDEKGKHRWVWIDLESGVPALFAMNVFSTLTYYLPKCIKHKEWLFDRVDTKKIHHYLLSKKEELTKRFGDSGYASLLKDCEDLDASQSAWKGIKRFRRSLYYAASQDKISETEKSYYENRALSWTVKSVLMLFKTVFGKIPEKFGKLIEKIKSLKILKNTHRFYKYFTSSLYRWGFARWYMKRQIDKWFSRKSIREKDRDFLKRELHKDDVSSYLTDFSIHIAIKPLVKIFTWGIVPILIASQVISLSLGAVFILGTGPAVRTLYTLWRFTHSLVKSRPHYPVIALIVGVFPVIGNFAFPCELIYRSSKSQDLLAKFIIYSLSAKIGSKLPIWGGQDSGTEHFMVKMVSRLIK